MIEAPPDPHVCRESANHRHAGYCDCGKRYIPPVTHRPRNEKLERYFTNVAAAASGFYTKDEYGQPVGDTFGLDDFADARAMPGGVRINIDVDRETAEEFADARNYLVWGLEPIYRAAREGDGEASDLYERRMRALRFLIAAWQALHTPSS